MSFVNTSKFVFAADSAEVIELFLQTKSAGRSELTTTLIFPGAILLETGSKSNPALLLLSFFPVELELETRSGATAELTLKDNGKLELVARSKSRNDLNFRFVRVENNEFILTVRVARQSRVRYHQDFYRFSVNGVEIPISDYTVEYPENASGCVVNVTLSKFADKSSINNSAEYKFELGKKINGQIIWRTIIDTGELNTSNLTIGFGNRARLDSFSLSTIEPFALRLGTKPTRDLIIYDQNRVEVNAADYQIVPDTLGVGYAPELKQIGNLTLYKLFKEIFVNRLGFADFATNILDSKLRQLRLDVKTTFAQAVGGVLGVFEPDFRIDGNIIWIRDTTTTIPPGFPPPVALTVDNYASLSITKNYDQIDAFEVIYSEDKDDWDFSVITSEVLPLQVNGAPGEDDYSSTEITRITEKFYRNSQPSIVAKEDLIREIRKTRNNEGISGETTEEFFYDGFGRQFLSTKVVKSLVPSSSDFSDPLSILDQVSDVKTTSFYGVHPFIPSRQVQIRKEQITNGIIVIDEDNPYRGQAFRQPIVVANRSGNISDTATSVYGAISKITETIQVLPLEQVRTVIRKEDFVAKNVEFDYSEVKFGEASSAEKGRTRRIHVFENDGDTFTGGGAEELPVNELPPSQFIPLARRKLKKRKSGNEEAVFLLNGLQLFMDRGIDYTTFDEQDGEIGIFNVRGYSFSGNNLGTREAKHTTNFKGKKV